MLNSNEQQLKAEAQTYSASVASPDPYQSQGFSRQSERSRYTSSNNAPIDDEEAKKLAEEEEEKKPDRLALLLAESKFTCEGLKNGYYADETVGCQVFHYCIDGVKHSWQCPENTVFHQIHLNCVPNTQDICQQSSKYHIVNEYLHKELDERGPNNTVLYHQRFYPDGFDYSGGDPVAQIFQAQAQAALQKAQQQQSANHRSQPLNDQNDDLDEDLVPRPRLRSRPSQFSLNQQSHQNFNHQNQLRSQVPANQNNNKPLYRQQANRPLVSYSQPQPQSPKPTSRPLFTAAPETFAPPTYTEQPPEDFSPSDFVHSNENAGNGAALQSGFQPSNQIAPSSFNLPSSQSFSSGAVTASQPNNGFTQSGPQSGFGQPGPVTTYSSSQSSQANSGFNNQGSQNTFLSTNSGQSDRFRTRTSSQYPSRSLGIPIASFRVAPASSFTNAGASNQESQASSISEVNAAIPALGVSTLNDRPEENGQILSRLFY
ncbi:hypothetical protein QR98_0028980 [Sarcoptes scabiei]|nr:hypothetical protein QR98_0028980 [Sarcoptes scabiei]